ncbi:Transposon Tf2-8 polyprotein [Lachnellula subtilissima]|uniref:Transposon Tf2-8 polyprotein n=1 Tax=Lachnellula subtilissima TaxID=602034 RepID=A0A8H8U5V8_9HELO|nr:Transposon Tf2-8 polyprotein [Lachnellula subtilissima]
MFYTIYIDNIIIYSKNPADIRVDPIKPFNFNNICKQAFISLKEALTSAPILGYFQFNRLHMLEIDASNRVIAAVLSKLDPSDNAWKPIAFISKTIALAEYNYPIYNKEMLTII